MIPSLQHQLVRLLPTTIVGYFAFIVYGSLIPFELRDYTFPEALEAFKHIRYLDLGVASRGDWVANILLYIPLGFLLMANGNAVGARHGWIGAIFVMVFCSLVAFSIEFLQIFFKPRTVSENDLIAEHIGSALGIAAWWLTGNSLLRSLQNISLGGKTAVRSALFIYAIALFTLALFPFDILISFDEIRTRLDSDLVGLLMADRSNGGFFRSLASFIASSIAYAPIGLLLLYSGKRRNGGIAAAVVLGALLGATIEALQFFVASAVSEGLGIVAAVLGVSTGYMLGIWSRAVSNFPQVRLTRKLALFLLPAYLMAGMALNGWFSSPWQGIADGLHSFDSRSLIPFYYHYFSTEAAALRSTIFNAALYLPIGLVFQALRIGGRPPAASFLRISIFAALGIACVLEIGKLFVINKHPDFTNLIIAVISSAGGYLALSWVVRHWQDEPAVRQARVREPEAPPAAEPLSQDYHTVSNARVIGACALILLLVALLVHYPLASPMLVIGLVGCAVLVQRALWSFLFACRYCWSSLTRQPKPDGFS
jgi:VanZ family protein